jgi:threonine dehydrogenase-like Zn-dependent dehydrogenase
MKAALSQAPWEVHIEELSTPQPGEGEVRLKVAYCGLCGSDLHRCQGGFPQAPLPAGHEISGVVEAVGAGARGVEPGDHVCVEPIIYCGRCRYCRTGYHQLCDQAVFLAVDVASLITHRFPLERIADAYQVALKKEQDLIKALIVC